MRRSRRFTTTFSTQAPRMHDFKFAAMALSRGSIGRADDESISSHFIAAIDRVASNSDPSRPGQQTRVSSKWRYGRCYLRSDGRDESENLKRAVIPSARHGRPASRFDD
jgi:hypothetical protein